MNSAFAAVAARASELKFTVGVLQQRRTDAVSLSLTLSLSYYFSLNEKILIERERERERRMRQPLSVRKRLQSFECEYGVWKFADTEELDAAGRGE